MGWGFYAPYVPVAQRRANALREVRRMAAKGKQVSPVEIAGRAIASTFWGKAWCDNLESYSDFSNRLPRGRTYVRNGSVVDLQIETGKIMSMVSGSSLYRIAIRIRPLAAPRWKKLKQQCGTGISSVVELLQGRLSTSVMSVVTSRENGLFPAPAEIEMSCSCPDWAEMCKHVAATLYSVGNRLDRQPELLFKLRQVDHLELIAQAGHAAPVWRGAAKKTIAADQLADVFGIELETKNEKADNLSARAAKTAPEKKAVPPQKKKVTRETKAAQADSGNAKEKAPAAAPASKAAPATVGKSAAPQKKSSTGKEEAARSGSKIEREKTPAVSGQPSGSQLKPLTAAARKRIAEAQRKRWQGYREKLQARSSKENPSLPAPAKSAPAKQSAKRSSPARSKSARLASAE